MKCHGCFVPSLQFSWIVNDYLAGVDLPLGDLPPPPPLPKGAHDPKFDKVVCIACSREMDRFNFASRSGAIVDVCNMHGIWLDAGELVSILHFVKTRHDLGGVPVSDEERHDDMVAQRRLADALAAEAKTLSFLTVAFEKMKIRG